MKNKMGRALRFLLFFARLFIFGLGLSVLAPLDAQEAGENGEGFFYTEKTGDTVRFIQHITWEKQEYAYRYEVTIEKQSGAGFSRVVSEFTHENFIEVSLTAGHYRYRVAAHDLFDIPGEPSAWTEFDIHLALEPGITEFRPQAFWLDEDSVWVLSLDGRNFIRETEVYLRSRDADGAIIPLEYVPGPSGTSARLVFDERSLTPGLYDVYMKNPGGLESVLGTFRIAYRRPFDINLSMGYGPLIPLYGDLNTFFDKSVFPLGIVGRISVAPLKRVWGGYLGLELAPFWAHLSTSGEGYEAAAQYIGAHINALFQKWLPNRIMAFNFRIGAGMVLLDDLHFEFSTERSDPLRTLMSSLGAGASFMWFVSGPFFIEGGVEYMHFFSVDPVSPGYLRPILNGGVRF